MRNLAAFIMRGPFQAIMVTAGFTVAAIIPILSFLSVIGSGALALVTLRRGAQSGLRVMGGAALVVMLPVFLLTGSVGAAAVLAGVIALLAWVPVWGVALVLRSTRSWSVTLDVSAGLGVVFIVLVYAVLGDPVQAWTHGMERLFAMIEGREIAAGLAEAKGKIPEIAKALTSSLAVTAVLGMIIGTMVGRWWQAMLYNPGGFRQEFTSLRQSNIAAVVLIGTLLLSAVGPGVLGKVASDAMPLLIVVYGVVGMAIIHAIVYGTGRGGGWLIALYVLLVLATLPVMMMLAVLALTDRWADYRRRALSANKSGTRRDDQ